MYIARLVLVLALLSVLTSDAPAQALAGGVTALTDVLGRSRYISDLDRDGWDDLWCALFPTIVHRDKSVDSDRDGLTDYQEMVLFTDPYSRNPWPRPRNGDPAPQEAGPPNNTFSITFATETGRPYLAQSSTDLQNWTTLEDWFLAPGTEYTIVDNNAVEEEKYYGMPRAIRSGFDETVFLPNDDDSTTLIPIGFALNYFDVTRTQCFVNNNGNITFEQALGKFTPEPFREFDKAIIAAFWADVDTTGPQSSVVTHGQGTLGGRSAFGVNYVDVGYFRENDDLLNQFQIVLIDRSDLATGDFDLELNYSQVLWETGDVDGGTNGLGGQSARVGLTDGGNGWLEYLSSGVNSALLDFLNPPSTTNMNLGNGLVYNSELSPVPGRYVIPFRGGSPTNLATVDAGSDQTLSVAQNGYSAQLDGTASLPGGAPLSALWILVESPLPPFLQPIEDPDQLDTTVNLNQLIFEEGDYVFELRVWSQTGHFYTADQMTITWTSF